MTATLLIRIRASQTEASAVPRPSPAPLSIAVPSITNNRGYLHDTGAARMLMTLLSCFAGMLVSPGRGKEGAKGGDKERQYAGALQRAAV